MNHIRNILLIWLVLCPWWSALLVTFRGKVLPEQSWKFALGIMANNGVIWEGHSLNIVFPIYLWLHALVTGNVHQNQTHILSRETLKKCFVKQLVLCNAPF